MKVTVDRLRNGTDFKTCLTGLYGVVSERDNGGGIRVIFNENSSHELVQKTIHPKVVVDVEDWTDLLNEKPVRTSLGASL